MTDQQLINISQAPMLAFNKRDWGGASFIATADFVWADVAVNRKIEGVDPVIEAGQALLRHVYNRRKFLRMRSKCCV